MDMTSEELLEHYRDVQEGKLPTQIRGELHWHSEKTPLFQGWAFRNYLLKPFLAYLKDKESVRVLDHGCGKAAYLYDTTFSPLVHQLARGKLQSFYCYDPGYRPYMVKPRGTFDVIISAGVVGVIPEKDIDATLVEMRDWCSEDGIVFFKVPRTAKQERCFVGTNESMYINDQPIQYWIDKFDRILQRRYFAVFADTTDDVVVHKSL